MTYLKLGGNAQNPRHIFKPLLPVEIRHAERSWMNDTAEVLVQVFCEKGRIALLEAPNKFAHDFDLGGIVGF